MLNLERYQSKLIDQSESKVFLLSHKDRRQEQLVLQIYGGDITMAQVKKLTRITSAAYARYNNTFHFNHRWGITPILECGLQDGKPATLKPYIAGANLAMIIAWQDSQFDQIMAKLGSMTELMRRELNCPAIEILPPNAKDISGVWQVTDLCSDVRSI